MKAFKRTSNQEKIINAMDKVYDKLIEYKKTKKSVLVVIENNKIVRIKP